MDISEGLLGVVIGAAIASIVPLVSLRLEHNRWKQEKKLEYLQNERRRLEETLNETLHKLSQIDVDMDVEHSHEMMEIVCNVESLMPNSVSKALRRMMDERDWDDVANEEQLRELHNQVTIFMKEEIAKVDREVHELIEK